MSARNIQVLLKIRQAQVFRCEKRFIVLVAGRRWGKTMLALAWLLANAVRMPGSKCYYIAPTYRQAKRTVWNTLKELLPSDARQVNEQEQSIVTNGSLIQLHGADNPDTLRGVGLDFVVMDEYATMKRETWEQVIRPALADRMGRAMFIGTPKGFNHFYDLFLAAGHQEDWAAFQFTTAEGGYVSREELAAVRAEMNSKQFEQEFCASFENLQGRVYYGFDRKLNVIEIANLPTATLMIGMDFNVNPMTAVVAQRAGDQCQVFDEIVLPNSNTQEMLAEINRRYKGPTGIVYPDPSGGARKTSAPVGETDFSMIRAAGWALDPSRIRPLVDRINNVNAMLCTSARARRLLISPKCVNLIKALDGLTYKDGTKLPDKRGSITSLMLWVT